MLIRYDNKCYFCIKNYLMKEFLFLFLCLFCNLMNAEESIYDIRIKTLEGESIDLNIFKGKKILFVNVASLCGFTKQYSDLQKLQDKYIDDLVVIGIPCNQFGQQEPGSSKEIRSFCESNYNISFLITDKMEVKGDNKHPLYSWLTEKEKNGKVNSSVKWNFQKYLVGEEGVLLDYFYSITNPLSSKILKHLN